MRIRPSRPLVLLAAVVAAAVALPSLPDGHAHRHGVLDLSRVDLSALPAELPTGSVTGPRAVVHGPGAAAGDPDDEAYGEMHYVGKIGVEPTLGVDDAGRLFYVAIETELGLQAPILRSDDGGATWDDVTPRIGPSHRHPRTLDPMLHLDQDTGRVFSADLTTVTCSMVSFSDDQGASWDAGAACGPTDHQNVFTGPPRTSTTSGYPNVVYYCAIDGGALAAYGTATSCLKSLDGGVTFVRTGEPAFVDNPGGPGGSLGIPGHCGGATGHGFVDDEGVVYLPRGWCGQPYLAISHDEGATWQRVQVADNGFPRQQAEDGLEEHEAGVAVDSAGTIYYVWTAKDRLPYLATSSDGGHTWSEPVMVGPPGLTEASLPAIDVGDAGRIAITYMGSTNAPGGVGADGEGPEYGPVTWNGYITTSVTADRPRPTFVTVSVNDPADPLVRGSCGIVRCGPVYDFIDVVIGPDGTPWTAMVDACPDPPAGCLSLGAGFVGHMVGGPPLRRTPAS